MNEEVNSGQSRQKPNGQDGADKCSPEQRLRKRLLDAGVLQNKIDFALEEARKRQDVRNRQLRERVGELREQVDWLRALLGANVSRASDGSGNAAGDDRVLHLANLRAEIEGAKEEMRKAADTISSRMGGSKAADSSAEVDGTLRTVAWILCVGMGVMAASTALILITILVHLG